jgi:REP element-mobilizing transposase RayT
MPRAPRKNHDGAVHHVIIKGCHGAWIVHEDADRRMLMSLFADACELFEWRCLTYNLLDNHMHLMLNTPRSGLSEGMQKVCATYARYFKPRQRHAGGTFQRPFKSTLVADERYFVALTRYIAFNPVRHGLCAEPGDWGPSAHEILLGRRGRDIINVSGMFDFLDGPEHYARLFEDLDAGPTNERDRLILLDARRGYSVREIAARRKVPDATVRRVLKRHGVVAVTARDVTPFRHS